MSRTSSNFAGSDFTLSNVLTSEHLWHVPYSLLLILQCSKPQPYPSRLGVNLEPFPKHGSGNLYVFFFLKQKASQQKRDREEKARLADSVKSKLPELLGQEEGQGTEHMAEALTESEQWGLRNEPMVDAHETQDGADESTVQTVDDAMDVDPVAMNVKADVASGEMVTGTTDISTEVELTAVETNDSVASDKTKTVATDALAEFECVAEETEDDNGQTVARHVTMDMVAISNIAVGSETVAAEESDVPMGPCEVLMETDVAVEAKDNFATNVAGEAKATVTMETAAEPVQESTEEAPGTSNMDGDAGLDPDVFDFLTSADMGPAIARDETGNEGQGTEQLEEAPIRPVADMQPECQEVDRVFDARASQARECDQQPETPASGGVLSEAERHALEAEENSEEKIEHSELSSDQSTQKLTDNEPLQEDIASVQSMGTPVQDEPLEQDFAASFVPSPPAIEGAGPDNSEVYQETRPDNSEVYQETRPDNSEVYQETRPDNSEVYQETRPQAAADGIELAVHSEAAPALSDIIQQPDHSSSQTLIQPTSVDTGINSDLVPTSSGLDPPANANGPSTEETKEDVTCSSSQPQDAGAAAAEVGSKVSQSISVTKSSHTLLDDSNKVTSSTGDLEDRERSSSSRSDGRDDSARGSSSRDDGSSRSSSFRDDRDRRRDDYHVSALAHVAEIPFCHAEVSVIVCPFLILCSVFIYNCPSPRVLNCILAVWLLTLFKGYSALSKGHAALSKGHTPLSKSCTGSTRIVC